MKIGYLTDAEGDLNFFTNYCKISEVLKIESYHPSYISLSLNDDCYFVFGGDTTDKGPGDIRICKSLIKLKQKYPERVFLILGNRDANKTMISYEKQRFLYNKQFGQQLDVFWTKHDPNYKALIFYIEEKIYEERDKQGKDKQAPLKSEEFEEHNTLENRIKWLLKHCMGAEDYFEFHRTELVEIQKAKGIENVTISNEEVLQSIFYEIEHGCFRKYLELGQLMCVIGNTVFVHGALHANSIGFVPSDLSTHSYNGGTGKSGVLELQDRPIQEWNIQLQEFWKRNLKKWTDFIDNFPSDYSPAKYPKFVRHGEALLAYFFVLAMDYRTVTVTVFFGHDRNPLLPDKPTIDYLLKNNIQRVVVGHKPVGDHPHILKYNQEHQEVEVVMGDTSYSAGRKRSLYAVQEVLIQGELNYNQTVIHGTLDTKLPIKFATKCIGEVPENTDVLDWASSESKYVGLLTKDGWWVKGIIGKDAEQHSGKYLLSKPEGRISHIQFVTEEEVVNRL